MNTIHIDPCGEPDKGAFFWIFHTTFNLEAIHPVFKGSLQVMKTNFLMPESVRNNPLKTNYPRGANDHACPVRQSHVTVIF